ncbi:MAG: tetratricopeptide repeat protein, partial [Vicinamibacterales bacterium]
MSRINGYVVPFLVMLVSIIVAWQVWPQQGTHAANPPLPVVLSTSRSDLNDAEAGARQRLAANAADAVAGVRLAEILLRKARVETNAPHAIEAEHVLRMVLKHEPAEYSALKLLGAVLLSQHRFAEAADVARRALGVNDRDAWNYGVLGDAYVEVGRYDEAFEAFDVMVRLRPDAASYARVAYAHELQGRLDEALRHMQMATEATSAHDPESMAWHHAQIGTILFQMGRIDAAAREFARADYVFPSHPYARAGLARVAATRGNFSHALALYRELMAEAPTPEIATTIGDLLARTGDERGAELMYTEAEVLEREGWTMEEPQPAALARMLAERGRNIDEAVTLAEEAARSRHDIFTMDTLAWAYFQAGRLPEARAASLEALRTGSVDRRIRCHAAVIERATWMDSSTGRPRGTQCAFEQW